MNFFQGKKKQNNSMYIGTLSKIIYTKELLDILDEISSDLFNSIESENDKYIEILNRLLAKLNQADIQEIFVNHININDIYPLTRRQMYCFNAAMSLLKENKIREAYHELYDCIQDYTNGTRDRDYVSVNEYIAFKFLTQQFLEHIRKMVESNAKRFCDECHKEVDFIITNEEIEYFINTISIKIKSDVYRCIECGQELNDNELFDKNCKIARNVYIEKYQIISMEEIKDIINNQNITIEQLSRTLMCNELTITKYLNGKLPTIEHSNMLRRIQLNNN